MMDVDEQLRQVLRQSLVPVDDIASARQDTIRRAAMLGRQRHWLRAAAVATAAGAAVAVVAALVWVAQPSGETPPFIAPFPDGEPTQSPAQDDAAPPACDSLRVTEQVDSFLDAWTTSRTSLLDDHCVLAGRRGPAPQFDTDDLGPELRLLPQDLPDDFDPEQLRARPLASGYPLVHLGRIEDTDSQMFLEWRFERGFGAPVVCVEGSCAEDGLPTSRLGVIGIGRGSGWSFTVWVAPEAAAVALEIDGQPVVWQRPVALTANLAFDGQLSEDGYFPSPGAPFEVRVLDSRGDTIATYEGEI